MALWRLRGERGGRRVEQNCWTNDPRLSNGEQWATGGTMMGKGQRARWIVSRSRFRDRLYAIPFLCEGVAAPLLRRGSVHAVILRRVIRMSEPFAPHVSVCCPFDLFLRVNASVSENRSKSIVGIFFQLSSEPDRWTKLKLLSRRLDLFNRRSISPNPLIRLL